MHQYYNTMPDETRSSSTSADSLTGSDDDSGQDIQDCATLSRSKRHTDWSEVTMKETAAPVSTTAYNSRRLQLFCNTGHFLALYPDGKVHGTQDSSDLHTHLEMISTDYPGHVIIRATLSNLFLRMTSRGRLRATPNRYQHGVVFIENVLGFYMTYLCRDYAHRGWYVGIKKTGKFKSGDKTRLNQKAVHFMKRYKR